MIYIILPAYNEEQNIIPLIESIKKSISRFTNDFVIIAVNDGSSDKTLDILNAEAEKLPELQVLSHEKNKGLAESLKSGFVKALELSTEPDDIIITMDADNTHTPGLIPRMLNTIYEGNDIVIASRYRYGAKIRGLSAFRLMLSWWASLFFRIFLPLQGVKDYTSGYRAYTGDILKKALAYYDDRFITEKGFCCMVDILLKMRPLDPIIFEVPLILRYDKKKGASKMNVARTIRETLLLALKRFFHLHD